MQTNNQKLGKNLALDELFDLTLYRRLKIFAKGNIANILDELIPIETRHLEFWQKFFDIKVERLNSGRRIKLMMAVFFCRVFGDTGIHLVLEAIEVYGVRKYLRVWKLYKDTPRGEAIRGILQDEFKREGTIITREGSRRIYPEQIRNIFLGFNDGLVEILGVISGFFAVFQTASSVLIAGFTVAVAGSISMAAGSYVAMGSEAEVKKTEAEKKRFLGEETIGGFVTRPLKTAFVVGISYFIGALVPISPVLFGAQNLFASLVVAGVIIILISYLLAVLSGMEVRKRITINLVIIAIAVGVTYTIGIFVKTVWGISL